MFKIGDKVRVVSDNGDSFDRQSLIGKVGEVFRVYSNGNQYVGFPFRTELDEYFYYKHELQKVEDKMFKKGMVIVKKYGAKRLILAECDGYFGVSDFYLSKNQIAAWRSEQYLIDSGYKPKQEEKVIEMTVEEVTKMVAAKEGRDVVVKIKK